jgi:DNA-binding GntR family transcriptional regulator
MTAEQLGRLEGLHAEMAHYAREKDYRRWVVPHAEFHRALTAPAGERFGGVLAQLILDACKAGDRDAAGRLLAQHFGRTAFEVIDELEPAHDPARLNEALADVAGATRSG